MRNSLLPACFDSPPVMDLVAGMDDDRLGFRKPVENFRFDPVGMADVQPVQTGPAVLHGKDGPLPFMAEKSPGRDFQDIFAGPDDDARFDAVPRITSYNVCYTKLLRLIREFLYHDGICALAEPRAHLFHARYKLLSMSGEDCLLVCPFLTSVGNIGGVVVVTVTKKIHRSRITSYNVCYTKLLRGRCSR